MRYGEDRLRVLLDERDMRGGEKSWEHIKKGVPIRLEVGPRDMDSDSVFMGRRDREPRDKQGVPRAQFLAEVLSTLDEIQDGLLERARARRAAMSSEVQSVAEFEEFFSAEEPGFAWCFAADDPSYEDLLGRYKVTPRCIPVDDNDDLGTCIFTGQPGQKKIVFARSY